MRKVPERKQKKRERRSKDRRPKSKRRKDFAEERQIISDAARLIVSYLPRKEVKHANEKFLCTSCHLYYCVGFDGNDVFCRECHYRLGCLKLASGATNQCNYCEGKEVGSEESHVIH
ncbi:MAG: hypothetical protein US30_C0013G0063 [Candidatus Moranbacteria bacterium GW2011_GWF2_36_839]|nr:MAG: hypothetical protein US27_C0013G0063 [Candidatus Moranbacteria bacterium GW2011_GWF1_36_78]KKQ16666.1 MAG: hypothetical protein US30_C0013G0063 [Candidatus Moranbacteria bacterium GW2011_GWF2_36_839]